MGRLDSPSSPVSQRGPSFPRFHKLCSKRETVLPRFASERISSESLSFLLPSRDYLLPAIHTSVIPLSSSSSTFSSRFTIVSSFVRMKVAIIFHSAIIIIFLSKFRNRWKGMAGGKSVVEGSSPRDTSKIIPEIIFYYIAPRGRRTSSALLLLLV